jgi:hypothetical protein
VIFYLLRFFAPPFFFAGLLRLRFAAAFLAAVLLLRLAAAAFRTAVFLAAFLFLVRAAFLAAALRLALDVAINFSPCYCVLCGRSHVILLNYSIFLTQFFIPIMIFDQ